jgi:ABC-type transport system substrate-binding protein
MTSRRVQILAVNQRKGPLQNRDLRTGLAHAINREVILAELAKRIPLPDKVQTRFTAPMVGPFPPSSWANTRGGIAATLTNPDEGLNQLKRYLATPGASAELALIYPDHDPRAALACKLIKEQVDELFKPEGRKLTLTVTPVSMPDLLVRVMDEHRYDLAYLPFDYPDDWYPYGLAAFLDPAAGGRGGRNYTGFRVAGSNPDPEAILLGQWLEELRNHGDYEGKIAPQTARIHDKFNAVMPFIPLWQLDRYTVISDKLKVFVDDTTEPADPRVLNPSVLFHNAGRWRMD